MDPERWQHLKELFEAAVDKRASERAEFLDEACRSDPGLRKEVEALLNTYGGDTFLEKPAYEAAPDLFESEAGDSLVGTHLGPYDILSKIGKGGMGIVFLAQDTRLDRPVAIKMLAPKYTRDSGLRERLKREAKAAAKFSHPGIATVYSLEEAGESLYIVSEYVRGPTLRQIMDRGSMTFPKILNAAIQIARALAAAHGQGIIHRDLKPENVVVTESGGIKILDFGLARVTSRDGTASSDPRLTHRGMFLGTPAYASPEQLLGSEVDERTDIFSLGVILYEMAADRHPFLETDSVATIARILEGDAQDLIRSNPAVSEEFDRIVRRCLDKQPENRYNSSHALLAELEKLQNGQIKAPAGTAGAPVWWWQFHQAFAGFGYYLMLYPMWRVKKWIGGVEGSLLFFPLLVAVGIAANLRLHLWFTSKYYRSELPEQRRRVSRWIRWADYAFALMLAVSAVRIHTIHAIIATLLMAVAIGALVASLLIEPTTARAALDKKE